MLKEILYKIFSLLSLLSSIFKPSSSFTFGVLFCLMAAEIRSFGVFHLIIVFSHIAAIYSI